MRKLDPGIVILVLSLLAVGGGFAIGFLTSLLSPIHLGISFLIVSIFVGLSFVAGLAFIKPSIDRSVARQQAATVNAVREAVSSMQLSFSTFENRMDVFQVFQDPDWVITTKDLVTRELQMPKEEVWIVSSYLGGELDKNLFAPVIEANTSRGVHYYYVIPEDHLSREKIKSIRNMVSHPDRVHAIEISERHLFQLLSTHDTCVFDPFGREESSATGYMNVPNDLNELDYFVKLGVDYSYRLVSTVKAIGTPIDLDTVVDHHSSDAAK